jgi:mono/diheme cytochrome c family protein
MRAARTLALAAGVAVAAALAGWMAMPDGAAPSDAGERAVVAQGRAVYDRACASCHGANLEGQPQWQQRRDDGKLPAPPHDASGHTWHHTDEVLFRITRDGIGAYAPPGYVSDMPAYAGVLSDDEIRAALAYIRSRWPASIRARQPK